ncbi:MAG: head GIN domain-containing protein [Fidelibacterota bacterium]
MKTLVSVVLLGFITVILAGVNKSAEIRRSENITSEERELSAFDALYLDISAQVTVRQGKKFKCVITAEENIIPSIETKIKGYSLHIDSKKGFSTNKKVDIAVEVPLLTVAVVNGSGIIDISEVSNEKLTLAINGSGDIRIDGFVDQLKVTINGSGDLDATELEAEKVTVTINGSGDANVRVRKSLTANIHGSGDIVYWGTPTDLNTSILGSGDIIEKAPD